MTDKELLLKILKELEKNDDFIIYDHSTGEEIPYEEFRKKILKAIKKGGDIELETKIKGLN